MTAGKKETLMLVLAGIIPVTWLGLKFAPFYAQELITAFERFDEIFAEPFAIDLCRDSLRSVLIFNLIYLMGIGIYISMQKNYRRGEDMVQPDGVMHQRSTGSMRRSLQARISCLHRM